MPTSAPWPTADMGCDLVKISASGADADLEILRPGALGDEMLLQPHRRLGAGLDGPQVRADHGLDPLPRMPAARAGSPLTAPRPRARAC